MTASKLPPERRDELARVAGRTSFNSHGDGFAIMDALHAAIAGPLEAERDALQKRVEELERSAPAQEPSATDPRDPAWWTCRQFHARFEAERARAAHNEACADFVREYGAAAYQLMTAAERHGLLPFLNEAPAEALRTLLNDEET